MSGCNITKCLLFSSPAPVPHSVVQSHWLRPEKLQSQLHVQQRLPWDSPQDVCDGFGELATTSTTTSTTVLMVTQVCRWNRRNWCAVTTTGRNSAVTRNGPRLLMARSTQPGLDVSLFFCWRSFPFCLLGHVLHTVQLGYNKVLGTGKIALFYPSIHL